MKSEMTPPDRHFTHNEAATEAETEAVAVAVTVVMVTDEAAEIEGEKPRIKTVMNTPAHTVK